jgi:hypothetical protein
MSLLNPAVLDNVAKFLRHRDIDKLCMVSSKIRNHIISQDKYIDIAQGKHEIFKTLLS